MLRDPPRRGRHGFTLVELLVVIAIIGLLLALALPAVQKVRAASQRSQCANNLRQIGIGLLHYEEVNGSFPPGEIVRAPGASTPAVYSWVPCILPYIDKQDIYGQYRFQVDWNDPVNWPAIQSPLNVFQCPAAPGNRVDANAANGTLLSKPACGDYNGEGSVDTPCANLYLQFDPPARDSADTGFIDSRTLGVLVEVGFQSGVFPTRVTDIKDGTSNTIMVVEDAGRPQVWRVGKADLSANGITQGGGWADCEGLCQVHGSTVDGQREGGPCAMNCENNAEAYSFHSQGCNILFTDGSVHFLNAGINIAIFAALATRSGREIVTIPY
jgi:prepilin-type N-terminal cleavage/methylation domain-containing protein/prepilin-type processing-associated H-X9-DG protein